ncbi:MAG: glycine oxidase ThiO [Pirellulaceae bacterium]
MSDSREFDFAIVGGGVIGLSIAWEMAQDDNRVALVERDRVGRQASWAGAGILPPSNMDTARHALEYLAALSFQQHPLWAEQLKKETGIDTGFRQCGAVFVARTAGEVAALRGQCEEWRETEITTEELSQQDLIQLMPALAGQAPSIRLAVHVLTEAQLRNPDHLQALRAGCEGRGVQFFEQVGEIQMHSDAKKRRNEIRLQDGTMLLANKVCIAAGVWSELLLKQFDVSISTIPVRGQMLLFKLPQPKFTQIVYEGTRYIVPRDDGHVLAGSTLEEAGFDDSTTPQGVADLLRFANGLFAELNEETLVDSWAGLRPASFDGFPYIGRVPNSWNVWAATGHFRSGLLLSTGTAKMVANLMQGCRMLMDVMPFRLDRG